MGWASAWGHNLERALAYARQAIDVAAQVDAKQVLASGHFTIGWVYAVTGQLDQAREETSRALTISQRWAMSSINRSRSLQRDV